MLGSRSLSNILVWALALTFILLSFFHFARWKNTCVNGGDTWGYYTYLPATFIHGDIQDLQKCISIRHKQFPHSVIVDEQGLMRVDEAPYHEGVQSIKYTYGISAFYLPAFAISHIYATINPNVEANGYSPPYIFCIYAITILYIFIGLYFLRKFLLRFYEDKIVHTSLLIVLLATNLYYFAVYNNGMSHTIQFMLWSILLYATDSYYRERKMSHFLWMAFTVGMITIIRPTEIISLLVPLFYGFDNLESRVDALFGNIKQLILGVIIGISCVIPQLVYWKYVTGHWIYNSYTTEGFDFTKPEIIRGLFGFMNGWFVYSPIMLLGLLGLFLAWKKKKANRYLFSIILCIHIYVIFSWWNWYYINSFGMRAMVDLYPVWTYFLCAALVLLFKKIKPFFIYTVILLAIALNVFQTYQVSLGVMLSEIGNWGYYQQSFGKTEFTRSMNVALDMNERQKDNLIVSDTLIHETFDDPPYTFKFRDRKCFVVPNKKDDQPVFNIPYEKLLSNNEDIARYIQFSIDVFVEHQGGGLYTFDTMILEFVRADGSIYKRRYLRLNNKTGDIGEFSFWWGKPHVWTTVEGNLSISSKFKPGEKLRLFFNKETDQCTVYVDNLIGSIHKSVSFKFHQYFFGERPS